MMKTGVYSFTYPMLTYKSTDGALVCLWTSFHINPHHSPICLPLISEEPAYL